ncbi:hypothetical protein BN2476_1380011 [Paraburkholderia piptadeniae]|uniref:Uncharacterized protein n=1 Tax=Paraburkholderia piptadeniae TaxID=1701573 RepID=A0A1N7SWL2_9BURK|nr:hypothetical protein BN2476_1380011 [Paraburkholderia piptadeniae]
MISPCQGRGRPAGQASRLAAHAAQFVSKYPQGAVKFDVLIDAGDGACGRGPPIRVAAMQTAANHVFLDLCGDAAYVEKRSFRV